ERYSAPFKEGEYIYFYKNDGLQNQAVLYRKKGEQGTEEVFLDPNSFSEDGTTSLAGVSFSKDGSLVAYQISEGGSDWRKVIVWKTDDKSVVGDVLVDVKFSQLAWRGNEGFYYSSYDRPEEGSSLSAMTDQHKLYFHQLHTPQSTDDLVFGGIKTPRRYINAYLTEDEHFLVVSTANTTSGNDLYIRDLTDASSSFITIVDNFEKNHEILGNEGSRLLIYTELGAPNGKVVTTSVKDPRLETW